MSQSVVIIGAGLAGANVATELRDKGFDGSITLIGAEDHPPYERPPLSKAYLMGSDPIEKAFVHEPEWYAEHDIDLRLGTTVTAIDPAARQVTVGDETIGYDALVLATGASPRRLGFLEEAGVSTATLRTIEDSDRIKAAFGEGKTLAIVGAGWIGLEVAAAAREAGTDVVVFEQAEQPLLKVVGPKIGALFAELHRSHGVDLRLGASVTAEDLADADLVVVGAGAVPNVELAEQAGLAVDNGVLVDDRLRTSDPSIYAIGDIANVDHPVLGRRSRVEHWDTAIEQGKTVAHNILGADEAYDRLPYFFTDQYDLGMEYIGSGSGEEEVVIQGDPGSGTYRAFWLDDGVVAAGMHVNDWDATDEIRDQVGKPLA